MGLLRAPSANNLRTFFEVAAFRVRTASRTTVSSSMSGRGVTPIPVEEKGDIDCYPGSSCHIESGIHWKRKQKFQGLTTALFDTITDSIQCLNFAKK